MEVLKWGKKFPFSEYIINRFFHLFNELEESYDLDDFIEFLHDHHSDADPVLPRGMWLKDELDQIHLAFSDEIGQIILCLTSKLLADVSKFEDAQKVILAAELVVINYLDRVGGYLFKPANFTELVKYCAKVEL